MGSEHLRVFSGLAPWVRIAAVADTHPPLVARATALAPSAAVFHDALDCVSSADIDAAVVATADATHHEIVDACIARGIYVLCEKPLTTSAEQSLQLVEAERAAGRRLVRVGFMRRYDRDHRQMYETLRAGAVGEPILVGQRHRNPLAINRFNASELIASSASHDIDLFRWLTGEEIAEVSATTKSSSDHSAVTVLLTLKSQSGILGVMELGRGPGQQYEVGCDIVAARGTLTLGSPVLTSCAMPDGVAAQRLPATWIERFGHAYRAQDAGWLGEVATESITGPSAYDGYAANAVIEAALSSLENGPDRGIGQRVRQAPAPSRSPGDA